MAGLDEPVFLLLSRIKTQAILGQYNLSNPLSSSTVIFHSTTTSESHIFLMDHYSSAFEKIMNIFATTRQYTIADFLLELFGSPTGHHHNNQRATGRSLTHGKMLAKFMKGGTSTGVGEVLQELYCAAEEFRLGNESPLWTLANPYQSLKSGYAALTSFAAQNVRQRLHDEQHAATDPHAGLHVFEPRKPGQKERKLRVAWDSFGEATLSDIQAVLERHQPLTFSYILHLACPGRHEEEDVFRYRPPNVVCQTCAQYNSCL